MFDFFLNHIDILFTAIICCLYLINIFFTDDLLYRFLIFLGSMFIGIINYAFILYQEDNFLMFLFLNCFFIVIVFSILLYTKLHPQLLEYKIQDKKNRVTAIVTMIIFLVFFGGFGYIFTKIYYSNNQMKSVNLLVNSRKFIKLDKENNNIDVVEEIIDAKTANTNYHYIKTSKKFGKSSFLMRYNSIVMLYIIYVLMMYFLTKTLRDKNER